MRSNIFIFDFQRISLKSLMAIAAFFAFTAAGYGQNSYSLVVEEDYSKPSSYMWEKGDEFYTGTIENGMYVSKAGNMHAQLKFGYALRDRQEPCLGSSDMEYTIVKLKGNKESFLCVQVDPSGDKSYPYLVFQYNELGDWKLTNYLQDKTYSSGKATVNAGPASNVIRIEHRNRRVTYYVNGEKVTELKSDNDMIIRWYDNKIYTNDKKVVLGLDKVFFGGCVTDKEDLIQAQKKKEEEARKVLSDNYVLYRHLDWTTKKYGFADADKKIVIPDKYDEVSAMFSEGLAVVKLNGKYGFVDKTGKDVVELKYDYATDFYNGFAVVSVGHFPNSKYGLINRAGKEVIPPKYELIRNNKLVKEEAIAEGMVMVQSKGYGFCDTNGVEIVVPQYEAAYHFSEGMAAVSVKGKWGFIDKTGKMVVPPQYDIVKYFSEGLCAVNKGVVIQNAELQGGKWGFIDKTGTQIIPNKYNWVYPFSEGLALVRLEEGRPYEFIDKTGKTVLTPQYDYVNSFVEGLSVVAKEVVVPGNDFPEFHFGCIDKTGKEVIPLSSEMSIEHEYFSEGLVGVSLNSKKGYMDRTGKVVIPYQYDGIDPFINGRAMVKIDNQYFYIDKSGQVLK